MSISGGKIVRAGLIGVIALAGSAALGQTKASLPKVGDAAPALSLDHLLQAPRGSSANWDALRGKVVVLEFWATWCVPCVRAIPHLNCLADKFKGKPVQFISISDEPASKVRPFLQKHPISSWIGLDTSRATQKRYGVGMIPRTIVVDREGKIAAVLTPTKLRAKTLNHMLAGKDQPAEPVKSVKAVQSRSAFTKANTPGRVPHDRAGEFPLYQVVIRPAIDSSRSEIFGTGALTIDGATLRQILASIYRVGEKHIECPAPLDLQRYALVVATPDKHEDSLRPMAEQALETTFGWTIRYELRDSSEIILQAPDGPAPSLRPSRVDAKPSVQTQIEVASPLVGGAGVVRFQASRSADLCRWLEERLGQAVTDRTKLPDRYDFTLKYSASTQVALAAALRKQLGLVLRTKKRNTEVLLVKPNSLEPTKSSHDVALSDGQEVKALRPLYQITIKNTYVKGGRITADHDAWRGKDVRFKDLVGLAFDMPATRVVGDQPSKYRAYEVVVIAPAGRPHLRGAMLQESLEQTFGLTVSIEDRELDSWVLSIPKGQSHKMSQSLSKSLSEPRTSVRAVPHEGALTGRKMSVSDLAQELEVILDKPVLDETGLVGEYDWNLTYDPSKPESLIEAVRRKLGLQMTAAKRKIEVLVAQLPAGPKRRSR